jgi:hypothetical protein
MLDRVIAWAMLRGDLARDDYATYIRALTARIERIDRKRSALLAKRVTLAHERESAQSAMRGLTRRRK